MTGDQPVDEFVTLKNGKKALLRCSWADSPERTVILAIVLVDTGSGFATVVGSVDGPISQDEANK
jgi:hypothetical protein